MKDSKKLMYLVDTCCENMEDVVQLLDWIDRESIDEVYKKVHYMYDENDRIKRVDSKK